MIGSKQQDAGAQPNHEWVLVVDDDKPMHELIATALGVGGLQVVTAGNGIEAFQALDQHATEPLLVLTDVLMPGMDGLTLARKLKARLKLGKIVVMSGHLADVSWWPSDLREVAFLAKPFRMAELTALVEAARTEFKSKL
jgi:two-component system cell cycle sensor histidine kinase/response regulator CckA